MNNKNRSVLLLSLISAFLLGGVAQAATNWSDPNTNLGSNRLGSSGVAIPGTGSFGRITGTRTSMRQLQFSLKLVF